MNKILITGSGGFVGSYLYHLLADSGFTVFGVDRSKKNTVDEVFDLASPNKLVSVLNELQPDTIIHLAAFSDVELCEVNSQLAFDCNILPVALISDWAGRTGARVIFISSDYVFDGTKGEYSEEDIERPIQNYGMTKLFGEKLVSALPNGVILRPTVIYGWDPDGLNFFMQLFNDQMGKKDKKIPTDQINNPTYVKDLCELIKKIIQRPDISGLFLTTGSESMSRYEFAERICEQMGWDKKILKPTKTEYLGQIAKRPLNNSTDSKKICDLLGYKFDSLEENLKKIKMLIV